LDIKNELLVLIVVALQSLGKENITPNTKSKIAEILVKDENKSIFQELHKTPIWIAQLIKNISEKNEYADGMVQTA
jgi:hypothetical protein